MRQCSWCLKFNIDDPDYNCCTDCVAEQTRKYSEKTLQGEWSRAANADKEAHSKDILQPFKEDGTVNKHFVEAHGTKVLEKELKVSKREIMENVQRYG